jgi:putative ATP-grasp target RiPP
MKKENLKDLLITPFLLSMFPVSVSNIDVDYDHEKQLNVLGDGTEMSSTLNSTTWNGTQTFDFNGNPNDSDNDSDADPF